MNDRSSESVLGELVDELRLQAWLARREASEPSLSADRVHQQASALARMRDTLRVQLHLGELDARDEFEKLEGRWRHFMQHDLVPAVDGVAAGMGEFMQHVLDEIGEGYERLKEQGTKRP